MHTHTHAYMTQDIYFPQAWVEEKNFSSDNIVIRTMRRVLKNWAPFHACLNSLILKMIW